MAAASKLVNSKTRAILVNNPSNPCGSNFSKSHLEEIIRFAEEYKLPIISDEVYANMVFDGQKFFSLAALSCATPIICVGGLAKQFLVPGYRLGWILLYDKHNRLRNVYNIFKCSYSIL